MPASSPQERLAILTKILICNQPPAVLQQAEKEKAMANNRVLNRLGARELTAGELKNIVGGRLNTLLSVIFTQPVTNPDEHLDS